MNRIGLIFVSCQTQILTWLQFFFYYDIMVDPSLLQIVWERLPWFCISLVFGSIDVSLDLQSNIWVSSKMSRTYFLWEMVICDFVRSTSILRKYFFSRPKSLFWKCWNKCCLISWIPLWLVDECLLTPN